ncbi:UNVERIFIED_CONTAM: hypothetical protein K2H54_009321 [Gekko kuhli]
MEALAWLPVPGQEVLGWLKATGKALGRLAAMWALGRGPVAAAVVEELQAQPTALDAEFILEQNRLSPSPFVHLLAAMLKREL